MEVPSNEKNARGPVGIRGGVKGSDPVWGSYLWLRYPNWAAKFGADALMNEVTMLDQLERREPLRAFA